MGGDGSLGPAFTPGILAVRIPVRAAFGLALGAGFPSRLSCPLRAHDVLSWACRPSQTAAPPLSPRRGNGWNTRWMVLHWRIPAPRGEQFIAPIYTLHRVLYPSDGYAVKLHED